MNCREICKVRYTLLVLVVAIGSTVKAEETVVWGVGLETHGEDTSWNSSTQVDAGAPQYNYNYQINELDVLVDYGLLGTQWTSALSYMDSTSGSGTHMGGLPVVIYNERADYEGNAVADF